MAGVLVVLLLATGAVLVASRLGQDPSAGGGESARSSATPDEGSGDTAKDNGTDNATDSGTGSEPASEAEAKEQFVRDYYAAAPGGTDEAWAMLGPDLKSQGRGAYDGFWRGIESVDVQSAEANGNTVDVTLVYRSTDGTTSTERKREGLVPDGDGGWLLNTDEPAS